MSTPQQTTKSESESDGDRALAEFTEPTEDTILQIDDVTAGYGDTVIIQDITAHVDEGEIVTLIGPNGAGKSTMMKSVYGFTTIHDGQIAYQGQDVTHLDPVESLRNGMAYVLQDSSIFPKMTVDENLMMGGFILNDDDKARELVENAYDEFDRLAERRDQKAKTLSGGERRLLELARALILDPPLLMLDEPSIGLEPKYIEMVFDRIEALNDMGKTILMVEQNAEKGLSVSDRGYVLADGQLRYEGTGEQLLNDEEVGELYLGG